MIEAQVTLDAATGVLSLSGEINYRNGPALRQSGLALIRKASTEVPLVVDCGGVDKSSSVGIALLLSFMRDAKARGISLSITNLPEDMRHIAEVSSLLDILPLAA